MNLPPHRAAQQPGRKLRRLLRALALILLGAIAAALAVGVRTVASNPDLEPWHRFRSPIELTAGRANEVPDLAAYRKLEERLFEKIKGEMRNPAVALPPLSRFDPASPSHPSRFGGDWNRTFELTPEGELVGEALLLHGLSDSPYSMRAVGQLLARAGYHVVGLRLPGHGVAPGLLAAASREDWRAAVRLGVAATGGRARKTGRPFVMVGYSNGAALSLDYTLAALLDDAGPVPSRIVFLSPAIAVSRAAAAARWVVRLSALPGLEKLAGRDLRYRSQGRPVKG